MNLLIRFLSFLMQLISWIGYSDTVFSGDETGRKSELTGGSWNETKIERSMGHPKDVNCIKSGSTANAGTPKKEN